MRRKCCKKFRDIFDEDGLDYIKEKNSGGTQYIHKVKLGKYKVLHILEVYSKMRRECFVLDQKDVKDLSNQEITQLVKSSPKYKIGDTHPCKNDDEKYIYVQFNKTAHFGNLHLFTKEFLNLTKDSKMYRCYHSGSWNPNPKLYKYEQWVFHNGVKSDNMQEMINSNESRFLNNDEAESLVNELKRKNEPYAYLEKSYPRLGVKAFNYEKKFNPYTKFALALEDDENREEIIAIYEKKGFIK